MNCRCALFAWVALATFGFAAPASASGQGLDVAFRGAEVYAGAVFPTRSERGASFGATLWLGTIFHPRLLWGPGVHYATADRTDGPVAVRDIVISLDFAYPLVATGRLYPYLGVTGGVHSVEATVLTTDGDPASLAFAEFLAEDIGGYKLGGGGFAGLVLLLTETGSMGLLVEYRLVGAPDVTHQEGRAGIRFSVGGR